MLVASQAFFNGVLAVEVILLGRWFDSTLLGFYFFSLSLGSILEVFVHWGAQHYVNREAASDLTAKQHLPLFLRFSCAAQILIAAVLMTNFGWPQALIAAGLMMRSGAFLVGAIFVGRRRVVIPILGRVSSQLLLLLCLLTIVRSGPSLESLSLVEAGVGFLHLLAMLLLLPKIGYTIREGDTWGAMVSKGGMLARAVWPFTLLFFLGQLIYRGDAVLLAYLVEIDSVAKLMLAFKWIEGMFFVAAVVSSATIPLLVESASARIRELVLKIGLMLCAGLSLLALGMLWIGIPFLEYALGQTFFHSRPFFRLLVWCIPLQGLGFFFATTLVALNRERPLLVLSGITILIGFVSKCLATWLWDIWGFAFAILGHLALYLAGTGMLLFRERGKDRVAATVRQ